MRKEGVPKEIGLGYSKLFYRIVPCDAFCQNYTNGSAPLNKRAAISSDKKYFITTSSKSQVQIQKNISHNCSL